METPLSTVIRKNGRPTKLHPAVVDRILYSIRQGASYDLAAKSGGITRQCLYQWLASGETSPRDSVLRKFYEDFQEAVGVRAVSWLRAIDVAITKGNWIAAAWKLERCHPETYGRYIRKEISGPEGGPIENKNLNVNQIDVSKLTSEQIGQLEEILQVGSGGGKSRPAGEGPGTTDDEADSEGESAPADAGTATDREGA